MARALMVVLMVGSAARVAAADVQPAERGLVAGDFRAPAGLSETSQFDHGCPPERILVIRCGSNTCDLDVCGAVRRYKVFNPNSLHATWLDVTSMYPPSSLPPPLEKQR
jgi:hypothetical protein